MERILSRIWQEDEAQDIAEYAVICALLLVLVLGTVQIAMSGWQHPVVTHPTLHSDQRKSA